MIPEKIVRFLQHQGNLGLAGLRDEHLAPFGSRVCGWRLGGDGRTLAVFLPGRWQDRVMAALTGNGQIAVTVEEFPMHETYQLKGRYLSHRPIRQDDVEIVNRLRERFANGVRHLVPDEEPINQLRASVPDAAFAVEVTIDEVFVQTPGPDAGKRISPPPQA